MGRKDIMNLSNKEFYDKYAVNAVKYSNLIKIIPGLDGFGSGLTSCSMSDLDSLVVRYQCRYLSGLYDKYIGSGYQFYE